MSPNRTQPVDVDTLHLGRRLGQGGQGTVFAITNKKINVAGGDGWEVVFKEYNATSLAQLDADALHGLVGLLTRLDRVEGEWLCSKSAWPAAVVERNQQACGILMRAVPDRFHFVLRSLAATTVSAPRLANFEYLLNDDAYITGIGLRISNRDRLALLADLASTLARLHHNDIAVGDLSPKNLLFTTRPQPECFLIDCDAFRLQGATVLPQAETPDWQIPANETKATSASDVYKFGLLAVRMFARDQTSTDPVALSAIDPALGQLARLSLDYDATHRPTSGRWAEQLNSAMFTASIQPIIPLTGSGIQPSTSTTT